MNNAKNNIVNFIDVDLKIKKFFKKISKSSNTYIKNVLRYR